ncbi:MAG: hypothetical protein KQH79_14855 [Bacteroidetes bacterium]|nr:hypothetical protein [Bacteroidota bacterium]
MRKIVLYLLTLSLFASCSSDYDLEKSILIYDAEYPNLPIYSEWGYNTFGAYYDRQVFISNDYTTPLKVVSSNNITSFTFSGQLNNAGDSHYSRGFYETNMAMTLTLNNLNISEYTDLILLNDSIIDLTNDDCSMVFILGKDTIKPSIPMGEFHFKKAQHLFIDEEPTEVILSGIFNFQLLINNEPKSISHGRFDVTIREYDIFNY